MHLEHDLLLKCMLKTHFDVNFVKMKIGPERFNRIPLFLLVVGEIYNRISSICGRMRPKSVSKLKHRLHIRQNRRSKR